MGVVAGLAALVAAGDERACLVCTRGEELGFLGALEAARLGTVPKGAPVLSLETSKHLPGAPQGGGVVVRVGDLRTIFDPGLTAAVWARAKELEVPAQRRLMDGGTCEASAFGALGWAASGLALPLSGYHNQPDDPAASGPVPESVLVADLTAEVALLTALCAEPPAPGPTPTGWVDELVADAQAKLAEAPLPEAAGP
jgi:endoglucanase